MAKKNRVVDFDIASSCHIERLSFFENVYVYFFHFSKTGHYLFLNIDGRITFRVLRHFGAKTRAVYIMKGVLWTNEYFLEGCHKKKKFNCVLGSNSITPCTPFSNLINVNRKYYLFFPQNFIRMFLFVNRMWSIAGRRNISSERAMGPKYVG